MEQPCKYCEPPTRTVGCHSKCPRYLEWKVWNDERNEKIRKAKKKDSQWFNAQIKRKRRV